jgi:hypothetical protein
MTDIKKFKKGKHSYTRIGNFREVRFGGKPSEEKAPAPPVPLDIDAKTETGVYANASVVRNSREEIILDLAFIPPNSPKGRVLSRVFLSFKHAKKLSDMLRKATGPEK